MAMLGSATPVRTAPLRWTELAALPETLSRLLPELAVRFTLKLTLPFQLTDAAVREPRPLPGLTVPPLLAAGVTAATVPVPLSVPAKAVPGALSETAPIVPSTRRVPA